MAALALVCLALPVSAQAVPPVATNPPPTLSRAPGSRIIQSSAGSWVPSPTSYRYTWYRCTSAAPVSCPVAPGTGNSYVLRTADVARYIRVTVTAFNGNEASAPRSSNPMGPIDAAPPVNYGRPTVSGLTLRGQTFRADPGTWGGRRSDDPAYTYRWQRCAAACADIAGATGARYTSTTADVGRRIRVLVGAEGLGRAEEDSALTSAVFVTSAAAVKRLRPFPVLVVAGRLTGRSTRLTEFVVRAPRRAKVSVRCRGRRCPFGRIGGTVGKSRRLRIRRAQRTFRPGQVLEIRVTGRNRIGKFTRIAFRRSKTPKRSDSCIRPPSTRPSPC